MKRVFAASCRAVKEFAIRSKIQTPRVAGTRGDLFDGRTIRLETDHPRCDAPKIACAVARFRIPRAVTDCAIDPPVVTPAHIVDDRMSVLGAETGIEFFDFVRFAITVSVAQPKNVRRLFHDHAIFVKNERAYALEPFIENVFLIHPTIAIRIFEPGNPISRRTCFLRTGVLVGSGARRKNGSIILIDGPAAGIFRGLGHP